VQISDVPDFLLSPHHFIAFCKAYKGTDEEVNFARVFFSRAQSLIGRACVK
jgi:hypothetical protein